MNFTLKGSFWMPAVQQAESNLSRMKQEGQRAPGGITQNTHMHAHTHVHAHKYTHTKEN